MSNTTKGIIAITISAFGFALMAFFVRLCDDYGAPVSSFEKSFFRNAIALLLAAIVFIRTPADGIHAHAFQPTTPRRKAWLIIFARSLFGSFGIFGNFYALSKIPIGEAMTLNKTAPFFAVLFTGIFLKERVNRRQILALLIAFTGALLVIKPGFGWDEPFAVCCALAGGLGAGIAYTCVHELGRLGVGSALIIVVFSAFSCLCSIPFIIFDFTPLSCSQLLILLGAGVGAAIGQFGVTAAYRLAEPRKIAVFDYTNIIFTSLFGFFFFAQKPDALSVLGFCCIIIAALGMNTRNKAA